MSAPELVQAILGIVAIDVVLSGDNAVVIAMATTRLKPSERRRAIVLGASGAIGLRVLCTTLVAVLLGIPLLQAVGGLLLLWIAYKLLTQQDRSHDVRQADSLSGAVRTIIVADAVMSLDNMLAVGGAAHGNIALLLFGLALSMPIIMFASGVIATALDRRPWLLYLGAAVLAYTASHMILEDARVQPLYGHSAAFEWTAIAGISIALLVFGHLRRQKSAGTSPHGTAAESGAIEDAMRADAGRVRIPAPTPPHGPRIHNGMPT